MNRKQAYLIEQVLSGADALAASARLVTPEELLFRLAPAEWHIHEIECRRIAARVESARPAAMANTIAHPRMGNVSAEWWALHAYDHTHTHIAQILDNRCKWLRVAAKR